MIFCVGKIRCWKKKKKVIETYKAQGRKKRNTTYNSCIRKNIFQAKEIDLPKELCYLTGEYRKMYLEDMTYFVKHMQPKIDVKLQISYWGIYLKKS